MATYLRSMEQQLTPADGDQTLHDFKFVVSLRLFDFGLATTELCQLLDLQPKYVHQQGQPRVTPKGQVLPGVYEQNYCCFEIPHAAEEDLAETLDRVLEQLMKHESLFTLVREQGGRSEFFIGWYSTGNTGEIFSSSLLAKLAKLQIDLSLDVYGETRE